MMYDPLHPNSYDDVKRRLEATAAAASAAVGAKRPPLDNSTGATRTVESVADEPAPVAASSGGPNTSQSTAEDLRRQRVALSAQLGVQAAIDIQREEHDAGVRARRAMGMNTASKANRLLQMMGGSGSDGTGVALPDAPPSGTGSGGLSNSLVFKPSAMGGGKSVLAEDTPKAPAKPSVRGKPSTVLLIRNLADPNTVDLTTLQYDMQTACANAGAVKRVRTHVRKEPLPDGWHAGEAVRVLVRLDTVASAFKAADALNYRLYDGRHLHVSFSTPTSLDAPEPNDAEPRMPLNY